MLGIEAIVIGFLLFIKVKMAFSNSKAKSESKDLFFRVGIFNIFHPTISLRIHYINLPIRLER